jgi:hypothetical protein
MTKFAVTIAGGLFWLTLSTNVLSEPFQQGVADDRTQVVNRFVVTLVEKDERHPWFGKGLVGRGHEIAFAIDSVPGKELTLVRGRTYEFEIRSTPAHDFYLSSSPFGRGREVLVNGVEGNYTHKGIVTFRPIASTPNIIYYQCQNHTYMGGVIYIVDRPGQTPQRIAWEDESGEVIKEPEKDPETLIKAVKNKIAFAMLSIRSSSAAKRIAESDHAEAQSMLHRADGLISEAQSAVSTGEINKAEDLIDDAIRTSSKSFQLVPDAEEVRRKAKSDYENLLRGIDSSLLSYQSYEHFERPGKTKENVVSPVQIDRDLAEGQRLASNGNYEAAVVLLQQTQQSLDNALAKLLDGKIIKYDLSFATLKDEYEYEQRRNHEYGRFLAIAISRLNPPESKMKVIKMLSEQGDRLRKDAAESAGKGKFDSAIETVQTSTSRYKQAVQMAGVQLFNR